MQKQLALDLLEGRRRRDEAIDRVGGNAPEEWLVRARLAVKHILSTRTTFTTDHVWALLDGQVPPEPRAMGAVMKQFQAAGLIVRTGDWVQSERPECHARPVAVWRRV